MSSKIQIINFALRLIKQSAIVDIADQNERARVANDMYEITRQTIFELCDWHCLRNRAKLTKDSNAPTYGFKFKYALPPDCIRVIGTQFEDEGFFYPILQGMFADDLPRELEYTIEGDYLYTNSDKVNILYIKDETDTSKYDALLVNTFAYLLALNMANPLSADLKLTTTLQTMFDYFSKKAKARNALDEAFPAVSSPFVVRRF